MSNGKQCQSSAAEQGRSMVVDRMARKVSGSVRMPRLPKTLNGDEKKYLLAVERGDTATVKRMIQWASGGAMDINCVDPLGRGALLMAIEAEQLPMVELLVVMGLKTADSLLHSIDKEFVEAVELLLEHEELIHKEGDPYSWENIDRDTATFTPEITPLILAAHRNNYEILKILLDRGAQLPMPHDIRCACEECICGVREDCLRHSASRINSYKALASPSLIALTSTDPMLTSFELSWELKQLSFSENEFRADYLELRRKSQEFAVALLSHTRTSHELKVMLNFDPNIMKDEDDISTDGKEPVEIHECSLSRLRLAIKYKQKKFVAHPWVQQLLAAIWYDGLPGFRQKTSIGKCMEIVRVITIFPFYCLWYMLAPKTQTGKLIRKPFMKFLIHASSYLLFLFLLILVSQRVEEQIVEWFEQRNHDKDNDGILDATYRQKHRGNQPRILELLVVVYVAGFIWEEIRELWKGGFLAYVGNLWNAIDFLRNTLYITVVILRTWAYVSQRQEIAQDPKSEYIPREDWDDFDPQLIAEGLFAAANIFSALKLVHVSSINPYLGPLQISLGRMVVDILKFFFFYSLVLFAFACGLNQLLWYFADLEKSKCYSLPGGLPDWNKNAEACMKWRRFGNLFESSQSLFWASFGMVGLADFELTGIKSYTRFWGLLMFGSYSVINVIVLLNLLIAMMSSSYAAITEKADTEWKFARTQLWLSYFDEDSTLPSPFNLFPTPKQLKRLLGHFIPSVSKDGGSTAKQRESRQSELREQAREYTAVMRALVWRYVSGMQRKSEETPVTEDDINEIKGEISTLRFDLMELFRKNGMNVATLADNKPAASLTRKTREWERRLLRGFHVAPAAGEENMMLNFDGDQSDKGDDSGEERGADRFRKMARLALLNRDHFKQPKHLSHIGRSTSSESFKSRQNLKLAMEEAKKLVIQEKSNTLPTDAISDGSISTNQSIAPNRFTLLKGSAENARTNLNKKLKSEGITAAIDPVTISSTPVSSSSPVSSLKPEIPKKDLSEPSLISPETVQNTLSGENEIEKFLKESDDKEKCNITVSLKPDTLTDKPETFPEPKDLPIIVTNITMESETTPILKSSAAGSSSTCKVGKKEDSIAVSSTQNLATTSCAIAVSEQGDVSDQVPLISVATPEKTSGQIQETGNQTPSLLGPPKVSQDLLPIAGNRVDDVKTIKRPPPGMWF